jgi:hypothetical protein
MFGVKQDKATTAAMAQAAASRSLSIVSQSGAKRNSAAGAGKKSSANARQQAAGHSIMPTIDDNAELKQVHENIAKSAAEEFEKVVNQKSEDDKLAMFGKIRYFQFNINKIQ